MKDYLITEIVQGMLPYLDNAQLMRLREKLTECLSNKVVTGGSMVDNDTGTSNDAFVEMFIAAKKVKGCSERTLKYYQSTIVKALEIKANKTDDRSLGGVRIATMHRVKGLEFDYVFAVAVNKKVLPFGTRADFEDDISLEEFRTGEKCLLYVALTRARKSACVTCYGGLSELIV